MKQIENRFDYLKYQLMISNMIEGFAYHQLVLEEGQPVDYIFVEVNQAFERIVGLAKQDIIGKRVTEIIPTIKQDQFDWIGTYGKVACTGESIRFESYSEALQKWFLISAFSYEKGYFAAVFQDITYSKLFEAEQQKLIAEYELIFNGTQDLMFLVDVVAGGEFRYRRLNRSHELVSGLSTAQVENKTPEQLFGPKLGKQIASHFKECVQKKAPIKYKETIPFPSGTRVWSTMLSPVFKGEKIVKIIGARRDVTEEQRAITRLKESEERYSNLFENNHSIMLIIDPENERIIDANPAACLYYGYCRKVIRTMNFSDINILSQEQRLTELKQAQLEKRKQFYFKHRLANGEIRDVEVYSGPINISSRPLLYSIIHDITERKQAEAKLYEEKERLHVTLQSIGDGVISTDVQGRITLLNEVAQQLTGWDSREAIGEPLNRVFRIIDENTRQISTDPVQKVLKTGSVVELENHTVLIAKNGTERYIADSAAPIKNEDGQVFGVVIVFRDVTEKKRQAAEINYLGLHDQLTGLYNRFFLERELQRLDRPESLPISLIMGDVNGLKLSNDIFGHETGDKLLKTIADILIETCGNEGIIARWGGDEFVILLPNTTNKRAASLCQSIERRCELYKGELIQPSIAMGVSTKELSTQDINLVLKVAEDLMYRRKLLEGKSVRSSLIVSLGKTLYERSLETEEHALRISEMAVKVGRRIGLSESEQDELRLLAILHDIGKIGIQDQILAKPGRLTPAEWQEMQKHPEIGYRIAQASLELSHIANLILAHHERWDGSGYPMGLKKDEIPRLARIISIIDAYDVMTHARPYKGAVSPAEAIEEIRNCAGGQFDPELADIFIEVISKEL